MTDKFQVLSDWKFNIIEGTIEGWMITGLDNDGNDISFEFCSGHQEEGGITFEKKYLIKFENGKTINDVPLFVRYHTNPNYFVKEMIMILLI